MAGAGGIQFGVNSGSGSNLFQLGANKTTAATLPTFGVPTTSTSGGISFGLTPAAKPATTGATPLFSLPGTASGVKTTTTQAATSAFSLVGKPASTTTLTFGSVGFGAAPASTVAATGSQPLFGVAPTVTTTTNPSTASSTAGQKQPDNPKETDIPPELLAAVQALEKHIKDQKAKKDEISRFSCKAILKVQEEISSLKQSLSVVSNGIQRDGIGVEMLKIQAAQDLKDAEIAQNVKEMSPSLHHDYMAPIEYFQRLVQSFEERINIYKQELDDLENYLSTASPTSEFTPQGLLGILKKLNDTFMALTAQMQLTHEEVKLLKNKYLQYRKVILGDTTNMFNRRKKGLDGNGRIVSTGPSPFTALAGPTAVAMATALNANMNTTHRPPQLGNVLATGQSQQPSLFKSSINTPGLSRSLSFGGIGGQKTGFGQSIGGFGSSISGKSAFGLGQTSLGTGQVGFGTSSTGFKPSTGLLSQSTFGAAGVTPLNAVTPFQQQTQFQLQTPPSGTKRGKMK